MLPTGATSNIVAEGGKHVYSMAELAGLIGGSQSVMPCVHALAPTQMRLCSRICRTAAAAAADQDLWWGLPSLSVLFQ
jgi:hypothetical protein